MKKEAIKEITVKLYGVPLPEVLTDAKHGAHTHFELITVTVCFENGSGKIIFTASLLTFHAGILVPSYCLNENSLFCRAAGPLTLSH